MKNILKLALILVTILSFICKASASDALKFEEKQHIQNFINLIKEDNPEKIAQYVAYPLNRFNPAPDIHNETEFIEKYDMLFDDNLKEGIINSDIEKDWSRMGWRGYMLYNGIIWLDSDNYKLEAVNYISDKENQYRQKMLEESKKALHPSIRDFARPILSFKTDKFIIRVDEMAEENYRYASWSKNKNTSDEPDIVIHDGIRHFYGTGGNHDYLFKNGHYLYVVSVSVVGPLDSAPFYLSVYKFNEPIQDLEPIAESLSYEDHTNLLASPAVEVLMNE